MLKSSTFWWEETCTTYTGEFSFFFGMEESVKKKGSYQVLECILDQNASLT